MQYDQVNAYVAGLVPPRPAEVQEMERIAARDQFPIIGPACGQVCYLLARLIGARRVFELGSGFGYSTYWFARAVRDNGGGAVHHTVWDPDLSTRARTHLTHLGLADLVTFHEGEAVATLRQIGGTYDLIFCDIDKHAYPDALAALHPRLRPGGLVIYDNFLLHGKVLPGAPVEPPKDPARDWRGGVVKTTEQLFTQPGWIASLLPLRDGLAVAMKA